MYIGVVVALLVTGILIIAVRKRTHG
jgi:hypothetical protein